MCVFSVQRVKGIQIILCVCSYVGVSVESFHKLQRHLEVQTRRFHIEDF